MSDIAQMQKDVTEAIEEMIEANSREEEYSNPEYTEEAFIEAQQDHAAAVVRWREASHRLEQALKATKPAKRGKAATAGVSS